MRENRPSGSGSGEGKRGAGIACATAPDFDFIMPPVIRFPKLLLPLAFFESNAMPRVCILTGETEHVRNQVVAMSILPLFMLPPDKRIALPFAVAGWQRQQRQRWLLPKMVAVIAAEIGLFSAMSLLPESEFQSIVIGVTFCVSIALLWFLLRSSISGLTMWREGGANPQVGLIFTSREAFDAYALAYREWRRWSGNVGEVTAEDDRWPDTGTGDWDTEKIPDCSPPA